MAKRNKYKDTYCILLAVGIIIEDSVCELHRLLTII